MINITLKIRKKGGISIGVAPLEFVGLRSSSSMNSFASWKMNGSGMEKEGREEMSLQREDESRRSLPP